MNLPALPLPWLRRLRLGSANPLADALVLIEAGALRLLPPRAAAELARQVAREGLKSHLIIAAHALGSPGRPAVIFEDRTLSWAALYERIRRLANWMLAQGIRPGDALAIALPNRPEFLEAQAAGLRVGALVCPINPRLPAPEARSLVERLQAALVVTHRPELAGPAPLLEVGQPYAQALASSPPHEPRLPREAKGRVVIFTSGTTGRPKGAVRSFDHGGSLSAFAGLLRVIPFRNDDVHMVVCPLYHSSGSGFAAMATGLGNTLVLVERFSPEAFCRTVATHRVTTTVVVPTMLHQLCAYEDAARYDLSSLRIVVCTGAPLREEVRERARRLLGDVLYDLYGSTEMAWVSIATPADQARKPGTVGRPAPGVEVRILDPQGRPVARGEVGEVWAASRVGMEGYLQDPELTRQRMRGGYISVRDLGYLDAEGYLHLVDRADDMIITGGVNVYPAEVEVALSGHPKVEDVAVLGIPDPRWGQRVVAAVVARGPVTPEELVAFCKQRLAPASVPKEIRVMEALPRNDIGKVDKRRLAAEWEACA